MMAKTKIRRTERRINNFKLIPLNDCNNRFILLSEIINKFEL